MKAENEGPNIGECKECGRETRGFSKQWLDFCPTHWQVFAKEGARGLGCYSSGLWLVKL